MEEKIAELGEYGVLGIGLLITIYFLKRNKDVHERERGAWQEAHHQEREEWRKQSEEQFEKIIKQSENHFQQMKEVSTKTAGIIADFRGLLESIDNHIRYKK